MKLDQTMSFDTLHQRRVALMGMSGVGKTYISNILRSTGNWFHYSVDYRLGRAYLGSHINDDLRSLAMRNPTFAQLLRADAITLRAKIEINNLDAMSGYLGQIGNLSLGGLSKADFLARQSIHCAAETAAMADTTEFIQRAQSLNYDHFVCDTSGSLCNIVDPWDAEDKVLTQLAAQHLILYIEASEEDCQRLTERFRQKPKPIYYSMPFFEECEGEYLETGQTWDDVDPDEFAIWAFEHILSYRMPRYQAIAEGWGYSVRASDLSRVKSESDFVALLAELAQN